MLSPGHFANVITSGISRLKCLEQRLVLFWRGLKFHFGREFHTDIITRIAYFVKCLIAEVLKMAKAAKVKSLFPPPVRYRGFPEARFL